MARAKYVYNPSTMQYERVETSIKERILQGFAFLIILSITSFGVSKLYLHYFPTNKEVTLEQELKQMKYNYALLDDEIQKVSKVLNNIKDRDESIYNLMLGVDPIDPAVWEIGTGGHKSNASLLEYGGSSELVKTAKTKVSKLEKQTVLFSKALDNVEELAKTKSDRLSSIPSIKPVREDKLKRGITLMSGYGMRMHPIHNIMKMHTGLDFTCPVGTKVRTTGNGVIKKLEKRSTGYGFNIIIDHGYGYETRYAHLSKMYVKEGDEVEKGEAIGEVGSTGTSTAPHLHYEVIHNGQPVDPLDFCLDGLTPSEYAELVNKASRATQSFD